MAPTVHTSKQFDVDLEALRVRVLQMGEMVESQLQLAIKSLSNGDEASVDRIIANDHLVNALEVEIDESCNRIITLRRPAANDLRFVMTALKTITDLERIGDEAKKIARMAKLQLHRDSLFLPRYTEIKLGAVLVLEMLHKALDAFARFDSTCVAQMVRKDEQLDKKYRAFLRYLVTFMISDPRTISTALDILFVAKAIERIGDHAKNISEYVVYMVNGRDVRHVSVEEIEREVLS